MTVEPVNNLTYSLGIILMFACCAFVTDCQKNSSNEYYETK